MLVVIQQDDILHVCVCSLSIMIVYVLEGCGFFAEF